MMVGGQFVTPAVGFFDLSDLTLLTFVGLYHKLHGVHRPNSMKKSIIKRRKRVVPAMQDHNPNISHITSFPSLTSPGSPHHEGLQGLPHHSHLNPPALSMVESRDHLTQEDHPMQEEQPLPIGVDFTGYQLVQDRKSSHEWQHRPSVAQMSSPSTTPLGPPSQLSLGATSTSNPRKRSHSNTERDQPSPSTPESARTNRLSSISSLLNPAQQRNSTTSEDMPIDPSLSHVEQYVRQHRHSTPYHPSQHPQLAAPSPEGRSRSLGNGDPGGWSKLERRALLQREISTLRESLRSKERELEDLDGDS